MKHLSDLETGDRVEKRTIFRFGSPARTTHVVARTTKTLIVLEDGSRYRRDAGTHVGAGHVYIVPVQRD